MKSQLFKAISLLFLLFALKTNIGFSQCENVSVASISSFVSLPIDSIVEADGMRNGSDYNGATLYYPVGGGGNYKSIVLVPGFVSLQSSVAGWARFFASRGFVAMTVGTNTLTDFPNIRALALLDGMKTLKEENNRTASPLYHNLDTNTIAVGGWSMGGGGAQLAAVSDARVKAVFAIAPYLDASSSTPASLTHASPILIICGQVDNVAPPAQHANIQYNSTPSTTKKVLFEIVGGDHNTGLSPSFGSGDVGNVAFAWMNLVLNGDDCYCNLVKNNSLNQHSSASNFLTNLACGTTSIARNNVGISLSISPNPTNGSLLILQNSAKNLEISIFDLIGRLVFKTELNSQELRIDLSKEAKGIYYIKAMNSSDGVVYKKIVLE